MTAETKYGSGYPTPGAFPPATLEGKLIEGNLKTALSHVQISAAAETASAYFLSQVPADCIPRFDSTLYHDAASTSVVISLTAVNPATQSTAVMAAGLDIAAAGSKLMLADLDDPANGGKEFWDLLGLAQPGAPSQMLNIYAVLGATGTAAATDITSDFRYSIVG